MKSAHYRSSLLSAACIIAISSCGGGGGNSGGGPPIVSANGAAGGAPGSPAAAAAAAAAVAAPIKAGEFILVVTPDSETASANAIPVHVLSLSAAQVAQYKTMGADNYWKSPSGQAQSRVFGSSGARGASTFKVPSRDGADTILIIAKLPPSGGGDARIMEVPLQRQASADPLKPTAAPISVRLSRVGLLPN